MIVFLNSRFVPEEQAAVSVFDRGFLYGDGLFETLLVRNGKAFRLGQHLDRLQRGAGLLRLQLPYSPGELGRCAAELIRLNQLPDAVLRIQFSRGPGPRGYSTKGADSPTLVMSLHPAPVIDPAHPPRCRLITSLLRIPVNDPLATTKTSCKLRQVLARMEAEELGADEALLLNTRQEVAGAASANLFWVRGKKVCTPALASGALDGVTRAAVFELCRSLKVSCVERETTPSVLQEADGVFLTLSTLGIVEVASLDGTKLKRSPLVRRLAGAYWKLVTAETGG